MGTSGNPAKRAAATKAKRVFLNLILAVDIDKPDQLDIVGYQHQYWPGEIIHMEHDYGTVPTIVDFEDGPITFHVTLMRIVIGEMIETASGPGVQMDPAYRPLMDQLQAGMKAQQLLDEIANGFADEVKDAIAHAHGDQDPVLARIDAIRAGIVRGVRQRG